MAQEFQRITFPRGKVWRKPKRAKQDKKNQSLSSHFQLSIGQINGQYTIVNQVIMQYAWFIKNRLNDINHNIHKTDSYQCSILFCLASSASILFLLYFHQCGIKQWFYLFCLSFFEELSFHLCSPEGLFHLRQLLQHNHELVQCQSLKNWSLSIWSCYLIHLVEVVLVTQVREARWWQNTIRFFTRTNIIIHLTIA